MYSISQNIVTDYFLDNVKDISNALLQSKSVFIYNYTPIDTSFIIDFISENYSRRENFFGRKKDNFAFVNLNSNTHDDTEGEFLIHLSILFRKSFDNAAEAYTYLEEQDKILVIYTNSTDKKFQRNLYSYRYYFGNRLLFVFNMNPLNRTESTSEFVNTEISGDILEMIVEKRLKTLGINEDITEKVVKELDGEISKIDEAIIKVIYKANISLSNTIVVPIAEEVQKFESQPFVEKSFDNSIQQAQQPEVQMQELNIPLLVKEKAETAKAEKTTTHQISNKDIGLPNDLTPRELIIFKKLSDKKFLSRDALAKIVWGNEWKEKGNDNAIDKVISRLRSKFVKAGYDKKYITSKKGEGIELVEN